MIHPCSYDDRTFAIIMDNSGENQPLLVAGVNNDAMYGDGAELLEHSQGYDEESAPVRPSGATVTCRVCDAGIDLEGKHNQHVVKCTHCQEATPIRPAPPGKKYVRCPCNCLLICKASSTRIACPRQNCRRVITLANATPTGMATRAPAGSCRVTCAHCQEVFLFNTLNNSLATCPHCKKSSSVGAAFARTRAIFYLVFALLALIGCVLLTVFTSEKAHQWVFLYAFWLVSYVGAGYLFYRFMFYLLVKVLSHCFTYTSFHVFLKISHTVNA
ncbi:unnamed protein product, partial [Mesorhabditis belari]|uniref:Phosphatidylinositol-4,5-bisphosphate 4-phosphatase n=1 Tax=Mesorhabditis belari TaxID=2138241 RepID=A0AAF3FEP7_9BILA